MVGPRRRPSTLRSEVSQRSASPKSSSHALDGTTTSAKHSPLGPALNGDALV
jgi:hypothetical protein